MTVTVGTLNAGPMVTNASGIGEIVYVPPTDSPEILQVTVDYPGATGFAPSTGHGVVVLHSK